MRHNKFIGLGLGKGRGWARLMEAVEQLEKYSPWLSRQIAQKTAAWPFWFSGAKIKDWRDHQVWVQQELSLRNTIEGEISPGHLVLIAELTLRLLLLRLRSEFPFRFWIKEARVQTHFPVTQSVDYRWALTVPEWECLRIEMAQKGQTQTEMVFSATLADGRLAATFTFHLAFELEKSLPA